MRLGDREGVQEDKSPDPFTGPKLTSQEGTKLKQNDNEIETLADIAVPVSPSPKSFLVL